MKLHDYIWLVPLFPLLGAVVNGLITNRLGLSKKVAHSVALLGSGLAWLYGWAAALQWYFTENTHEAYVRTAFEWISGGTVPIFNSKVGEVAIAASFQVDALSVVMLGFVTFVGFLIHLYSVGYMHGEPDRAYSRYFAYLNLFMFSMLTLVLGSNLPVLFVGWEGVGLCSYLLIGYYFEKDWCASAGKKAFIVNRIGDFGFLLAIFFTFAHFGTLEFSELFDFLKNDPHAGSYAGAATVIGLLLFVGAIGKSAQIPLYVWLPDAMAGPTPVSALIHAATMVTAGVYMVARCNFFYQMSPQAMLAVGVIGGVTAVFSATIGLCQNDIKKVLAYSTVSQLGYMFLAAGAGAYIAAIFHVVTHAFFKACLFLGSGSVIHACGGEQDMRKMGGLKKYMPTTYWTFWVATVAIAGIPPLAGFFSKDEILAKVFEAAYLGHQYVETYYLLWFLGVAGAFLTAFYMFRLVYMTFEGEFRGGEEAEHHLHESPWTMTLPLQILGVLSCIGGFLGLPYLLLHLSSKCNVIHTFLHPLVLQVGGHAAHGAEAAHLPFKIEVLLVLLSIGVAVSGIVVAMRLYKLDPEFSVPKQLAERFALTYKVILNKYFVDELYDATVIRSTMRSADFLWEADARVVDGAVNGSRHVTVGTSFFSGLFDLHVVDGLVNLIGKICEVGSFYFRRLQVGFTQGYATVMVLGAAVLLAVYWIF